LQPLQQPFSSQQKWIWQKLLTQSDSSLQA